MEEITGLANTVLDTQFIRAVISNPRQKEGIIKVKVRPLRKKGKLLFQFESFTAKQAFHTNLEREKAAEQFASYMRQFRQAQIDTVDAEYTVLISKKGKAAIRKNREASRPGRRISLITERSAIYWKKERRFLFCRILE